MKKSIITIIPIIFIILILIQTKVYAFSFTLNAMPEKQNIDKGQEVVINIGVSNIDKDSNGLNAISGKIEFDKNVFETISMTGKNNWTSIINDEQDSESLGKFISITTSGNVVGSVEIGKITLKAKENVEVSETKVIIKDIITSYNREEISDTDKEFIITINGVQTNSEGKEIKSIDKQVFIKIAVCVIFAIGIITTIIIVINKNKKIV